MQFVCVTTSLLAKFCHNKFLYNLVCSHSVTNFTQQKFHILRCVTACVIQLCIFVSECSTDQTLPLPTDANDYIEVISLKVVLSATVTRWYTQISIVNDELFEDDKSFSVSLETDDPAVILSPDTAIVTIVDEDEGQFWTVCTLHTLYLFKYNAQSI